MHDAARALALTERQYLRLIEIPIAMPVIMAGIRIASVWVIGTATLATPIGQTSLGNYIFAGLQTQNWVFVIFGCVAAAALALVVDGLLALIERGVALRSRMRVLGGIAGIVFVVLAALAPSYGLSRGAYVVGTKSFTEQYVLGALIQQRMAAKGLTTERRDGLGSAVLFKALTAGDVDLYVDYSGTIWANYMKRTDIKPRAVVLKEVGDLAQQDLRHPHARQPRFRECLCAGHAAQESRTTRHQVDRRSRRLRAAHDHRRRLRVLRPAGMEGDPRRLRAELQGQALDAGDLHVQGRRQWRPRCRLGVFRRWPDRQIRSGGAADPKQSIPPYDAILLIGAKHAHDAKLIAALKPLIGAIPVKTMQAANLRGSSNGVSPEEVAKWLWGKVGTK